MDAQKQADRWNQDYKFPISVILTDDDGKEYETRTRSTAWNLCGRAVVKVEGWPGGYPLDRLKPRLQMDKRARVLIVGGGCLGYLPGSKGTVTGNGAFFSNGHPCVRVKMDEDVGHGLFHEFVPFLEVDYIQPWRHRSSRVPKSG